MIEFFKTFLKDLEDMLSRYGCGVAGLPHPDDLD